MARGHLGAAEAVGPLFEEAELEAAVAVHAGVGGTALLVLVEEVADHVVAEGSAHVGHMVLYAEAVGEGAG